MAAYSVDISKDLRGARVALAMTGGVGDALMAIAGSAYALRDAGAEISAFAMPHQLDLLSECVGVDAVFPSRRLNDPEIRMGFDVVVDFAGTFNRSRELRAGDYYEHVSGRVGCSVGPGRFWFSWAPEDRVVAIHPASSNPNRSWVADRWLGVAKRFVRSGWRVVWLGTCDEFGCVGDGFEKLSDQDESLLWQVRRLAECDYFIGTDSGFAHAAGMLGVPGVVVFLSTVPEDVIGRYGSLKSVDVFGRLGVRPSRSLRAEDGVAAKCACELTVEDVLSRVGMSGDGVAANDFEFCGGGPRRRSVCVRGDSVAVSRVLEWISGRFNIAGTLEGADVVIACDESSGYLCEFRGRRVRLAAEDGSTFVRGLREFLLSEEI